MLASLFVAVSCVSHSAAKHCAECDRLEAEFLKARERLQTRTRSGKPDAVEQKRLIDRVAMAIARAKEHQAEHRCESCEKGMAAG